LADDAFEDGGFDGVDDDGGIAFEVGGELNARAGQEFGKFLLHETHERLPEWRVKAKRRGPAHRFTVFD
jgi:hypothetical protein